MFNAIEIVYRDNERNSFRSYINNGKALSNFLMKHRQLDNDHMARTRDYALPDINGACGPIFPQKIVKQKIQSKSQARGPNNNL